MNSLSRTLLLLSLSLGLLFPIARAEDNEGTTLFQDTPNSSEVLEALGEKPVIKYRGVKTRSIVIFDNSAISPQSSEPAIVNAPEIMVKKNVSNTASVKKIKKVAFPLTFEKGLFALTPESTKYVDSIASALKQKPSITLHISGHTDTVGGNKVNIPLSAKRAEAVKRYLVDKGIDPTRMTVSGEGSRRLLLKDRPTAPENRRVEFSIMQ
ncbi:exported hypothetical protein [Gammaproteobacteria bacterium]